MNNTNIMSNKIEISMFIKTNNIHVTQINHNNMVGKKKQNYTYEQMVEGILDKFIAIEPKIMVYKQKLMTFINYII